MTYSPDFATTLAIVAAKAAKKRNVTTPEEAAEFAWFSVNQVGDASIDDADFDRHYKMWKVS